MLQYYRLNDTDALAYCTALSTADQYNINDTRLIVIADVSGSMYSHHKFYPEYVPALLKSWGLSLDKEFVLLEFGLKLKVSVSNLDGIKNLHIDGSTPAHLPAEFIASNSMTIEPGATYTLIMLTDGGFDSQRMAMESWNKAAAKFAAAGARCATIGVRLGCGAEVQGMLPFLRLCSFSNGVSNMLDTNGVDLVAFPLSRKETFALEGVRKYPLDAGADHIVLGVGDCCVVPLNSVSRDAHKPHNLPPVSLLCEYASQWAAHIATAQMAGEDRSNDARAAEEWIKTVYSQLTQAPSRYKHLRELRLRKSNINAVLDGLRGIGKADKMRGLSEQQKANYLRGLTDSKNNRAAARRMTTIDENKDMASTVRAEFKALKESVHDLDDIDDADHLSSFISLETTLGAIRAIAQDMTDAEIDTTSLEDLVSLLHIVGIGVNAPIGDYPDPMIWHIKAVSSAYVSLADILAAASDGHTLESPGDKVALTNAVPVFDDHRIFEFCRRHLQYSLNLLAGIGMRRMMGVIPKTYAYTALNGIWAMVMTERSGRAYELARKLLPQAEAMFGDNGAILDHSPAPPLLGEYPRQIFLGNNGIVNMTIPIYRLIKQGRRDVLPQIYRNLHTYEYASVLRKLRRDGEFDCTGLDCLETDLAESPAWRFNHAALDKLLARRFFVRYMFLLDVILTQSCEEFKAFALDDATLSAAAGLDYKYEDFCRFAMVQAHAHLKYADRAEGELSLVADLYRWEDAMRYVAELVQAQYDKVQAAIWAEQFARELEAIIPAYAAQLAAADRHEFKRLYDAGMECMGETVQITTMSTTFWSVFRKMIGAGGEHMRKKALFFIRGGSAKRPFNGGNMALELITKCRRYLTDDDLMELRAQRKMHVYRAKENRHGHSNEKPSYYAMGYLSFTEFVSCSTLSEIEKYLDIHTDCCLDEAECEKWR